MRTVKAVIGSAALVVLMGASGMAEAQQEEARQDALKGDFALSGSAGCNFSNATFFPAYVPPAGFTANLAPIGHASSNSFSVHGVWSFNEDGTGTLVGRVVSLGDPDPGDNGAASAIDISGAFT